MARPLALPPSLAAALVPVLLGAGCVDGRREQVLDPVVLALSADTEPVYDDGETRIFQVARDIALPVRAPSEAQREGLADDVEPYGRAPFLEARHLDVTVHFTLTNLDGETHAVELLLDPWNEFVRYRPGRSVGAEDTVIPNLSGYDRFFVIPPRARVEGVLTPDDTRELAVDLATAMAIARAPRRGQDPLLPPATLMNRAMNLDNRSSEDDPVLRPYIPSTVAGLTGFELGLRTSTPANVAVEVVVDLHDRKGGHLLPRNDDAGASTMGPPEGTLRVPER